MTTLMNINYSLPKPATGAPAPAGPAAPNPAAAGPSDGFKLDSFRLSPEAERRVGEGGAVGFAWYMGLGIPIYLAWIALSALGAAFGRLVGDPEALGLDFLLTQYTLARPALPDVQSWANSRIALYQYRKQHPLPRRIGVRGVTVGPSGELLDEDGFTIVQRSGKYGRAGGAADAGGSVGVAKHGFEENKNKKSTDLQDFYRFQLREKKRQQLADLRAAFEADKEKVAKLKAGRRFKPY